MSIPSLASYPMPTPERFPESKVSWAFDPTKAVLLIHDMQDYFLRFYGENSPLIATLIEHISQLKTYCHQHNIPVVYTAQPNDQKPEDRALLNDMWGAGLNNHPELQQVVAPLAPDEQDIVLVKWRYSAFHRSDLESLMKSEGRDQLLICGVYGNIGCMVTATDAFMRDIKPFMVGDAIADFSEEEHRLALKFTATRAGRVIATQQVIATKVESSSASNADAVNKLTYEALQKQIFALLDEEDIAEFDADEELIDYGLDSVQIMGLLNEWRKQGIELTFVDLAKKPTLNAWWALIEKHATATSTEALA
ncbi:isochorismatase family protein [Marinomonas sp.]|uniref:isochorismatase family protein n=1 Tax=Marinomonas sp. TaxID=1904862 RepID=UPI003F9740A0